MGAWEQGTGRLPSIGLLHLTAVYEYKSPSTFTLFKKYTPMGKALLGRDEYCPAEVRSANLLFNSLCFRSSETHLCHAVTKEIQPSNPDTSQAYYNKRKII